MASSAVITQYSVSCLPLDHEDHYLYSFNVVWRSPDKWAVERLGNNYSKTGRARREPLNSSKTEAFKRTYRFSLEEALLIAHRLAPKIVVNGRRYDGSRA